MQEFKDLFENYQEKPSEELWGRISERLDVEMPVEKAASVKRMSFWKWAAVALSVLTIGGVTYGVIRHHQSDQQAVAQNTVVTPAQEEESVVVTEVEPVTETITPEKAELPVPAEQELRTSNAEVALVTKQEPEVKKEVAPKANVRQEVLPANSTLAKQLAADPVLKNLSDESVDWSLPVSLSIPNLFTPNDDGVNDLFVIEGLENYTSPRLVVRDKNNKVVYQSNAYKNTWGGEDCPEGVYSYEFTFKYNGIENMATGKVRIMRR
jgi:gliding motility-associated-like protein